MEIGPLLVVLLRLIVPLAIFRWPLWGTVVALLLDAGDVVLIDVFKMGDFADYSRLDKALDTYYLTFALLVSLKWHGLAKKTSIILFFYRLVGVILFEITHARILLFIFPNLFENWFLFWAARNRYFKKFQLTAKKLAVILVALLIPKMAQEYLLHFTEATPWNWFQEKTGFLK